MYKMTAWIFCMAIFLIVGCRSDDSRVSIEVRAAETAPAEGLEQVDYSAWGHTETFYLHDEVFLTESEIQSASVVAWKEFPAVEVLLTEKGRDIFADVTGRHIGKRLAVLVNGRLACAPIVRDTIRQGKLLINGDFSEARAREIAKALTRR
jgi:preprotein translocase subunit SecD